MKRKNLAFLVAAAMLLSGLGVIGVPAEELVPPVEEEAALIAEEPSEEIIEEPLTEEIVEEPVEEVIEEPVEEVIEEPLTEEIVEEPLTEEIVEEPAEEVIEEPVEEVIEEPLTKEIVEELLTEIIVEEPVEEVIEEPVEEVIEEPLTEEIVEEPLTEEIVEEPAEEVTEEPAEEEPPVITPEELEAGGEPIPTGVSGPEESPLPQEPAEAPVETPAEEPVAAPAEPTPDPEIVLTPEETFAYVVPAGSLSIGSTRLELRAAPDASSALLAVIDPGAYVRLLDESGAWAHIEYNGMTGYVDKNNVVVDKPAFDPNALSIRIWYVNEPEKVHYGDELTMQGLLVGFEALEYEYTLIWQRASMNRDRSVQGDWADIPGASGLTYTFTVDEDTEWAAWRLVARVRVPASLVDGL